MKTMLAAAALFGAVVPSFAQAMSGGESVTVAPTEATVKVEKVDRKGKTVTVDDPSGRKVRIQMPKAVQNLNDVQKGTVLKLRYFESAAVSIVKRGAPEPKEELVKLVAKDDDKKEIVVPARKVSGDIKGIDRAAGTLTLKIYGGRTRTFKAAEGLEGLDQAKVGERVVLRCTDAVAVESEKQGTAPGR